MWMTLKSWNISESWCSYMSCFRNVTFKTWNVSESWCSNMNCFRNQMFEALNVLQMQYSNHEIRMECVRIVTFRKYCLDTITIFVDNFSQNWSCFGFHGLAVPSVWWRGNFRKCDGAQQKVIKCPNNVSEMWHFWNTSCFQRRGSKTFHILNVTFLKHFMF